MGGASSQSTPLEAIFDPPTPGEHLRPPPGQQAVPGPRAQIKVPSLLSVNEMSISSTLAIEIFKINHFCGKTLHTSKNQEIEEKHPIHLAGAFNSFIESEGMAFSLTIHGI